MFSQVPLQANLSATPQSLWYTSNRACVTLLSEECAMKSSQRQVTCLSVADLRALQQSSDGVKFPLKQHLVRVSVINKAHTGSSFGIVCASVHRGAIMTAKNSIAVATAAAAEILLVKAMKDRCLNRAKSKALFCFEYLFVFLCL